MKFHLPETPNGKTHFERLNRVGSLPITKRSVLPTTFNKNDKRNNVPWPLVITAGDISRDGTKIILRSYNGKYNSKNIYTYILQFAIFRLYQ